MRDPARIERMLAKVGRLWKHFPDTRLGQLMDNIMHNDATREGVLRNCAFQFYLEDDKLEAALDAELAKLESK